eukprot:6208525-Pleurochrysis_carterae.AAC.2
MSHSSIEISKQSVRTEMKLPCLCSKGCNHLPDEHLEAYKLICESSALAQTSPPLLTFVPPRATDTYFHTSLIDEADIWYYLSEVKHFREKISETGSVLNCLGIHIDPSVPWPSIGAGPGIGGPSPFPGRVCEQQHRCKASSKVRSCLDWEFDNRTCGVHARAVNSVGLCVWAPRIFARAKKRMVVVCKVGRRAGS